MLQQRNTNQALIPALLDSRTHERPVAPSTAPGQTAPSQIVTTLEARANAAIKALRAQRSEKVPGLAPFSHWIGRVDALIRTDADEFLDRSDYDDAGKVRIAAQLDRFNRSVQAYRRFLGILKPYIRAVQAQGRATVRVLELASGSGAFTLALAEKAGQQKLPVTMTGSDYLPAHVDEGNRRAKARGMAVQFRTVNAFDMHNVGEDEFDLIFVAQTMHHFSPGQLAMMVEQASRKATHAFIGIDGFRSLELFGLMPLMLALNPSYGFLHDSFISMRKMYSEPELELIASLAAPASCCRAYTAWPGYSVLEVVRPGK